MDLRRTRSISARTSAAGALLALGLGACGGGDCGSSEATHELVSDQTADDAIACIQIGDKPQTELEVGGKPFCAEER